MTAVPGHDAPGQATPLYVPRMREGGPRLRRYDPTAMMRFGPCKAPPGSRDQVFRGREKWRRRLLPPQASAQRQRRDNSGPLPRPDVVTRQSLLPIQRFRRYEPNSSAALAQLLAPNERADYPPQITLPWPAAIPWRKDPQTT